MKVLDAPLDTVSRDARDYPVHLLRHGDRGLCLFAAGFLGINDAVHFARMEIPTTCVDVDLGRLVEMKTLYQLPGWKFVLDDAWQFAEQARRRGDRWDVVSVDSYTGDATDRSIETLELWCSIARRAVTATLAKGQSYAAPNGWNAHLYERSPLASWLVLTRA